MIAAGTCTCPSSLFLPFPLLLSAPAILIFTPIAYLNVIEVILIARFHVAIWPVRGMAATPGEVTEVSLKWIGILWETQGVSIVTSDLINDKRKADSVTETNVTLSFLLMPDVMPHVTFCRLTQLREAIETWFETNHVRQ